MQEKYPTPDDAVLLEGIKRGDNDAVKSLVESYQRPIFALCYRYVGNREDAEELSQDVFVRALRHINEFEPRAKLFTYLYRIAVNLSLNRIRDRKRMAWVSFLSPGQNQHDPASSDPGPETTLIQRESRREIDKAMEKLPVNQRTALNLKLEGLSYAEIAEVTGATVSAVETRIFRARQSLEKKLANLL
jgi:RNA polymerase sigma factor (sigma-70 family)